MKKLNCTTSYSVGKARRLAVAALAACGLATGLALAAPAPAQAWTYEHTDDTIATVTVERTSTGTATSTAYCNSVDDIWNALIGQKSAGDKAIIDLECDLNTKTTACWFLIRHSSRTCLTCMAT